MDPLLNIFKRAIIWVGGGGATESRYAFPNQAPTQTIFFFNYHHHTPSHHIRVLSCHNKVITITFIAL
jgi:hypothetical protein